MRDFSPVSGSGREGWHTPRVIGRVIYVCTTRPELDAHRRAVVDLLDRVDGWSVLRLEHFGGRAGTEAEVARTGIASSDAVVCLGQGVGEGAVAVAMGVPRLVVATSDAPEAVAARVLSTLIDSDDESEPRWSEGEIAAGRYALRARLGPSIWRAHDRKTDTSVAIRLLDAADSATRTQFGAAVRAAAALDHPHAARVLAGPFEHGDAVGCAMSYVPAGHLRAAVLGGRVADANAGLDIIERIADAAAAAHGLGIVHGDIEPARVLLTPDGAPKLTGFDRRRRSGDWAGFPYAAPERLRRGDTVVPSTDVYGLAATAVFAMTRCDLPAGFPTAPAQYLEDVGCHPAITAVLDRALRWDPDHRFADVDAFIGALRQARSVAPTPLVAKMPATGDAAASPPRGGRRLVAIVSAAAAMVATIAAIAAGLW